MTVPRVRWRVRVLSGALAIATLGTIGASPTHGRRIMGGDARALIRPVEPGNATPGTYFLMTVRIRPLTIAEYLLGVHDDRAAGGTSDMDTSKQRAWRAARSVLGPTFGVAQVVDGSSAAQAGVRAGDVITAIDDDLPSIPQLRRANRNGHRVRLLRGGTVVDVHVDDLAIVDGIVFGAVPDIIASPPLGTGDAKGPSAGLVLALADIDLMTPGSLSGGRRIAATGEVLSDGTILDVRGYAQKTRAAAQAGAEVFLVPIDDVAEVRALAPSTLRVIGVRTVTQAVWELCGLGGTSSMCGNLG